MFKDIFGVNPRTKILDFLCDHPGCLYSTQAISDKSNVSYGSTQYNLSKLHKLGIVQRKALTKEYQLNMRNKYILAMIKCDLNETDR